MDKAKKELGPELFPDDNVQVGAVAMIPSSHVTRKEDPAPWEKQHQLEEMPPEEPPQFVENETTKTKMENLLLLSRNCKDGPKEMPMEDPRGFFVSARDTRKCSVPFLKHASVQESPDRAPSADLEQAEILTPREIPGAYPEEDDDRPQPKHLPLSRLVNREGLGDQNDDAYTMTPDGGTPHLTTEEPQQQDDASEVGPKRKSRRWLLCTSSLGLLLVICIIIGVAVPLLLPDTSTITVELFGREYDSEATKNILLRSKNLTGTVSTELGLLTNLAELDLSSNQLSGSVPFELGLLTQLTFLDLSSNKLTGSVPAPLCTDSGIVRDVRIDCDRIVCPCCFWDDGVPCGFVQIFGEVLDPHTTSILDFNSSGLRGTIPARLGIFTQLTVLDLSINFLTGPIPSEFGQLTQLTWLHLSGNSLTGPIPSEFGQLTQLTWLDLSVNSLTGPIPSEFGQLANLTWLDLRYNSLTGPIPSEFGQLTQLTWLDLSVNSLTGPIPSEFGQLANLTWLDLSVNLLTGPIPSEFGQLTQLTSLDLGYNSLTGPIPSEFGQLTQLTWLDLRYNSLTGTIPQALCATYIIIDIDSSEISCPLGCCS
jgi:Leucine-rich repeat (LRR) protein